jgi:hypothetical protein
MSRTKGLASRVRLLVAGSLLATGLLAPIAVSATTASAASNSAFCQAFTSWTKHPIPAPTKVTIASYHAWVKQVLPYYKRMESTAPNAKTKQILTFVVAMLTYYGRTNSLVALAAYEKLHVKQFAADYQALLRSLLTCTLP